MKLSLLTTQAHSPETAPWQDIPFIPDAGEENHVVNLYPEMTFETMEGFGGAITDSAAYVYSLMDQRQKKELMDAYFSPERMGYRLARIHMVFFSGVGGKGDILPGVVFRGMGLGCQ